MEYQHANQKQRRKQEKAYTSISEMPPKTHSSSRSSKTVKLAEAAHKSITLVLDAL